MPLSARRSIMGEAKRRKARLGDRYGTPGTSVVVSEKQLEVIIKKALRASDFEFEPGEIRFAPFSDIQLQAARDLVEQRIRENLALRDELIFAHVELGHELSYRQEARALNPVPDAYGWLCVENTVRYGAKATLSEVIDFAIQNELTLAGLSGLPMRQFKDALFMICLNNGYAFAGSPWRDGCFSIRWSPEADYSDTFAENPLSRDGRW